MTKSILQTDGVLDLLDVEFGIQRHDALRFEAALVMKGVERRR